jgi:excisionase family DNA binding protein
MCVFNRRKAHMQEFKVINPLAGRLTCSPREAAQALGVSTFTVYGLVREGKLRIAKLGHRSLISVAELQALHGNLLARAA